MSPPFCRRCRHQPSRSLRRQTRHTVTVAVPTPTALRQTRSAHGMFQCTLPCPAPRPFPVRSIVGGVLPSPMCPPSASLSFPPPSARGRGRTARRPAIRLARRHPTDIQREGRQTYIPTDRQTYRQESMQSSRWDRHIDMDKIGRQNGRGMQTGSRQAGATEKQPASQPEM